MTVLKVKLNDGRVGTIDQSEYDPKAMQIINDAPQTPAPPQSLASKVGTGAVNILQSILKTVPRFAEGIGGAVANASPEAQSAQQSNEAAIKGSQALIQKASELNKAGKKDEAKRLLQVAGQSNDVLSNLNSDKTAQLEKGQEDLVKGGVGTGALLLPGGSTATSRILSGILSGAGSGYGVSNKGDELSSTAGGAVLGGLGAGAFELLGKAGSKIAGAKGVKSQAQDLRITGSKVKADPFYASSVQKLKDAASEIGITNATPAEVRPQIVEDAWNKYQSQVDDLLKNAPPVKEKVISDAFDKNLIGLDIKNNSIKDVLVNAVKKISDAGADPVALNALKTEARQQMGNTFAKGYAPTPKQEAWEAVYKSLKDSLDSVSPEIRQLNSKQHDLFGLSAEFAPGARSAAKELTANIPLTNIKAPINVSQGAVEKAARGVGGILGNILKTPGFVGEKAIQGVNKVGESQLLRNILTQSVAGQSPAEAQVDAQNVDQTTPEAKSTGYFGDLSKQDVLAKAIKAGLNPTQLKQVSDIYDQMQGGGSGKTLPAASLTNLSDQKTAIGLIPELQKSFEESKSAFGPGIGNIRGVNPYDTSAKKAKATIYLVKQIIGKGLEGGVLRKEDESKYAEILPKLGDTQATVENKIKLLDKVLKAKYNTTIETFQSGGYNPYGGTYDAGQQSQQLLMQQQNY